MKNMNIYLTEDKLKEIENELLQLERVQLPKAIEEVTMARGNGDLSENFEFIAAREEVGKINKKIRELRGILAYAKTITQIATDTINIGTQFVATSIRKGVVETKLFELVGYADLNKIAQAIEDNTKPIPVTISSPFGKAVWDKKEGEPYEYIDVDRNRVTGEIVSIVSEIEIKATNDKTIIK